MKTSVKNQLLDYLQKVPPSITHTNCELCGGDWLVTIANRDRYGLPVQIVMCRQCGLVFLNPRWDQVAYNKFYTDFYRPLISEWSGKPSTPNSNAREWFKKWAEVTGLTRYLPTSPRVVDIGGGNGFLGAYIRDEYGADVVIVEPNAGEAHQAAANGFEIVADVFENSDLEPASFDLVVMMRTVDHLIDASHTFNLVRHILKPSGVMLVDAVDYFRRMSYCQSAIEPLKIDHCYYFSPETLTLLMKKCGLHPLVSDVAVFPGQIVNLAKIGEPQDFSGNGFELYPGAEYRYYEWEQLANRPHFSTKPGYIFRTLQSDLRWFKNKVGEKMNGKKATRE